MDKTILKTPQQILSYFEADKNITYIKIKLIGKLESPWLYFKEFTINSNMLVFKYKKYPLDLLEYVVVETKLPSIVGDKKKYRLFQVSKSYIKTLLIEDFRNLL